MDEQKTTTGYNAVMCLAREYREWIPLVTAALEEAELSQSRQFAGAWVLERARKYGVSWVPNLKRLAAYGILHKEGDSSRGGRRAYYSMSDMGGVKKALEDLGSVVAQSPYPGIAVTDPGISQRKTVRVPFYANLASCGAPNMSEVHVDDYMQIDMRLAKPGHSYYLVRADGDSMDAAGINSGDIVLVRVQNHADIGQKVVACLEDGVTIKELQRHGDYIILFPRSTNTEHKPIILENNVEIQGVVVATIPNFR